MEKMFEQLSELGFPIEEFSSSSLRHLEESLAQFMNDLNAKYKIYPYEDQIEVTLISFCEPWMSGFMRRVLDAKHCNRGNQ